jgi:hypothetical protein
MPTKKRNEYARESFKRLQNNTKEKENRGKSEKV